MQISTDADAGRRRARRARRRIGLLLIAAATAFVPPPAWSRSDATAPGAAARFVLCGAYCGLVDGTGARVTERVFEQLDDFKGSVAIYRRHGKYGAIDRAGQRIVKPTHDALWSPANGVLVAEDRQQGADAGADGPAAYTVFDERGKALLRFEGSFTVDAWAGHVYYRSRCNGDSACPTIFIDGQGKQIARFATFDGRDRDRLAVASLDGRTYGYVDATLRFVIPPRYTAAEPFIRDVAKVRTQAGPALIDRAGREVVKAGRYISLYPSALTPLITAFRADQPNCPVFVRPDGSALRMHSGVCAVDAEYVETLGYAFIRDEEGRKGIVDASGTVLIRPTYPWLRAVSDGYLVFGDDAQRPKRFGLVDRAGTVVLPLDTIRIKDYSAGCCAGPRDLRDALLGVTAEGATGLLGLDGRWRVPARYKAARELSANLVAMRDADDRYNFFTADGQPLPLVSDGEPSRWRGAARPTGFLFWRRERDGADKRLFNGMADMSGKVVIPAAYQTLADAGDGFIALTTAGAQPKIGFADATGQIIVEPQFTELVAPFRDGAAVVRDASGDVVLLGRNGKTITRFATAFPEFANLGGIDQVDQALDRCIDPDPTAEPEEKPVQRPAARKICGDPMLRRLSRATEKAWRSAQAGACLPDVFLAMRPAYDRAIADCNGNACLADAMHAFAREIADGTRQCAPSQRPGIEERPLTASLGASLSKRLIADAAARGDDLSDGDGQASISFHPMMLGRRHAILAVAATSGHNGPIWLLVRNRRGGWDPIFSGYAGYLRPLEVTGVVRNGLPVLRTQQHTSCCEHAVAYHAYDGSAYKLVRDCSQRYDADETPLLFCEDASGKEEQAP
ncbi:WG repeat-containing protein [Chitinasiproducens palmae]|uniref:WG containing repeat-containing protein n=1 Tax=Chitinasiproducens palmae TaxID=1770053 RepID=A0A1H2PNL7_9BURK|nr:WG repeat-containing protein [Chitinasiproducens palmae]SDV47785.1 WG containing repeat-containing protein [Chitinasiproducens palmae]